ncbi:MAG: DNA mismatch repair protein MutS [Candidatus Dormibacteraceae bacterium]
MSGPAGATPAMRQYWAAKRSHPDAIVLFRLGDFFEIFFDDAVAAAPIMGVTLTSRPASGGRMPMCGVPHHSWQAYAGKLLRSGRKVVVCDQVEAAGGKSLLRREVTRVLTPGTVVEDEYLEPGKSNWLVAAWARSGRAGLAACDVSTGELQMCELAAERLPTELLRLSPSEVLTPPQIEEYRFDPERGRRTLAELLGIQYPASIGAQAAPLGVGAAGVLLEYLKQNGIRLEVGTLRVRTYSPDQVMPLDGATIRNLELGALFALLDRTLTPMGARLLRGWLWAPLCDLETIELRLGAVAEFRKERESLRQALLPIGDLERLTSRAIQALATPRELASLRRTIEALPEVARAAAQASTPGLTRWAAMIEPLPELCERLGHALVDDPPAVARAGGFIRPGFDPALDGILEASKGARAWIAGLEAEERRRTAIKNLKVGYNRVFGYYIEVPNQSAGLAPDHYIRKQTLAGGERYLTPELKENEAIVLNAEQHRISRELELLRSLLDEITDAATVLRSTAQALAELDALSSLAEVAEELGWARPRVLSNLDLTISAGRHPLVEAAVPVGDFVTNDVDLGPDGAQMVILTGPNMAGKSTYLRQVALIVLLAQCGSFVPAASAQIGIVDRIFTRVGAHDDLAAGMSTFMVEMTETASMLNQATPSSLLIFDEVGRGTSTYDGLSIAQAVVEYIHDSSRLGCRTLFATHYHELTALADRLPGVKNQRVEVLEEGDTVRFLHRVVPGGADRSYGIHVAALAGLPSAVVARARQILGELEAQRPLEAPEHQLGLPFAPPGDPLAIEIEALELDRLTPLEALQKLYEIRSQLGHRP